MTAHADQDPTGDAVASALRASADALGRQITQLAADPHGRAIPDLLNAATQWVQQHAPEVAYARRCALDAAWRRHARRTRGCAVDDSAALAAWLWTRHRCFVWVLGDGTSAFYCLPREMSLPEWVAAVGRTMNGLLFSAAAQGEEA